MIKLGTSGWYYVHWVPGFYPAHLEKKNWLRFYANNFSTVEVNASFYRLPFANMVKGWHRKTPKNFVFAFKGWRLITHQKKLKNTDALLERFYDRIKLVGDKLGPVLFQLPPSLHRDDKLLRQFLKALDQEQENVLEFRHRSWYSEEVYDLLREWGVGYCVCSSPDFPLHVKTTADIAYIRWHGKESWYRSCYSSEELRRWASEIRKLESKTKKVYGYFNNDFHCYAPANCSELLRILRVQQKTI